MLQCQGGEGAREGGRRERKGEGGREKEKERGREREREKAPGCGLGCSRPREGVMGGEGGRG